MGITTRNVNAHKCWGFDIERIRYWKDSISNQTGNAGGWLCLNQRLIETFNGLNLFLKKKMYSVSVSVLLSVDRQQFGDFCFNIESVRFDIESVRFDIESVRFDIESIWFDIASVRFDIKSVQYRNIAVEGAFMIVDIPNHYFKK